jgi:hypothetical protein
MGWSKSVTKIIADPDQYPLFLTICGISFLIFGVAATIPKVASSIDPWGRNAAGVRGVLLIIAGMILHLIKTDQVKLPKPDKYNIRILHPENGVLEMPGGRFNMSETYDKELPDGYSLSILELTGPHTFAFRRIVKTNKRERTWNAPAVWGEPSAT